MKRKIRVILIAAFLILGGTCLLHREHIPQPRRNTEPVVWQEFTCKDGAFSIQLPGTPTPLKESESLLQKLALSRLAGFSLERQDFPALFYVYYADVPEVYAKDRDGLLETTCSLARFM